MLKLIGVPYKRACALSSYALTYVALKGPPPRKAARGSSCSLERSCEGASRDEESRVYFFLGESNSFGGNPPLTDKNLLESNPLKSTFFSSGFGRSEVRSHGGVGRRRTAPSAEALGSCASLLAAGDPPKRDRACAKRAMLDPRLGEPGAQTPSRTGQALLARRHPCATPTPCWSSRGARRSSRPPRTSRELAGEPSAHFTLQDAPLPSLVATIFHASLRLFASGLLFTYHRTQSIILSSIVPCMHSTYTTADNQYYVMLI